MPRAGQVRPPTDERLSDRIAIGLLTRVFPAGSGGRGCGRDRSEVRSLLLPARATVYYVLAMCLFSGQGYEEVMRLLAGGLEWLGRWRRGWSVPSTAAIAKARARLGPEPLRELFERVVRPLAAESTQGSWYRGLRVVSMDGTTLDLADTAENDARFGRPGSARGEGRSAFPQVRLVGLGECGTHAVFAAALGPYSSAEKTLAAGVLPKLQGDMLLLADRGFAGSSCASPRAPGRSCCGGPPPRSLCRSSSCLPTARTCPGCCRAREHACTGPGQARSPCGSWSTPSTAAGHPLASATASSPRCSTPAGRLPAKLAGLYAQRWEFENALDEIKTHQRGAGLVPRSRSPDGVEQEVWGFLLVHWAIRDLMHAAALDAEIDPDRVSFTRALRLARRTVTEQAAFSPGPARQGDRARHRRTPAPAQPAAPARQPPRRQAQDVRLPPQTRRTPELATPSQATRRKRSRSPTPRPQPAQAGADGQR